MTDLSHSIAVVTGAAQGIGRAIATGLAVAGAEVVIADLRGAEETAAELRQQGLLARGCVLDVTDPAAWAALADELPDGLDILVNNAGLYGPLTRAPFEEISDEEWHRVLDVNVTSIFIGGKAMVPLMRRRGGGSIVNITSASVYKAPRDVLPYTTSKFAVTGMTQLMSRELGGDNIRVNAIAPGFTLSEGVLARDEPVEAQRRMNLEARSLRRDQTPDDVAGAVRFLCSSDAGFITGQTLVVDGGIVCH